MFYTVLGNSERIPAASSKETTHHQRAANPMNAIDIYHTLKQQNGDALLLFRIGNFYEVYHDDAWTYSQVTGNTVASRRMTTNKDGIDIETSVPVASFSCYLIDRTLAKLIAAGHRVAVCDQVEDANHVNRAMGK